MERKFRRRRTEKVIITNEARVLKELRLNIGLSLREVGRQLERSESYVRHIENGRLNLPTQENIKKILEVYGASWKVFAAKCNQEVEIDYEIELFKLVRKLDRSKQKILLNIGVNL